MYCFNHAWVKCESLYKCEQRLPVAAGVGEVIIIIEFHLQFSLA